LSIRSAEFTADVFPAMGGRIGQSCLIYINE